MRKLFAPILFLANLALIGGVWLSSRISDLSSDTPGVVLIAFGGLLGLLAYYLVLWQMLLIGRTGWIEREWGHDRLSRLHHYVGLTAITFIFFHPILILLGYSDLTQLTFTGQLWQLTADSWKFLAAFIAYVMFISIVAISVHIVRSRLRYETWYFIHFLLYAAIALSFFHQIEAGHDLAGGGWFSIYWKVLFFGTLATVLWYRFLLPWLGVLTYGFRVEAVVPETHDVASVIITGKNLERLGAQAGQFVIVRFLAKGFWWEAHPFSLSEMPKGDRLRLSIKAVGDFTKKIRALPVGTRVRVEGPLGRFMADRAKREKILLIAGGIGITPLRSLFEKFGHMDRDVDLLYAARSDKDFALRGELDALSRTHARIHYLPDDKVGRLTPEMIKSKVSGVAERSVYLCGPPPMMKAVRQQLESLGVPREHIMYEKFQLG